MYDSRISIIVPTYGRAAGMEKLFDSLRASTPTGRYEIVVVSSDPPETPKARWLSEQEDARVIFADVRESGQRRKRSNYYYLNTAIKHSSYPWIFPLSDDMYVQSDWYDEFQKIVSDPAHANVGLIIAASHVGSYKHAVSYGMRLEVIGKTKKGQGAWKDLYLSDVALTRRDVMERVGLFDENMDWFGSGADLSLAVEFLTETDTVAAPRIQVHHLISKENRGSNIVDEFTDFHYLLRKWNTWCKDHDCQYVWDPGVPPYTILNRIKIFFEHRNKILRHYKKYFLSILLPNYRK